VWGKRSLPAASLGKPVFAYAALRLADEGKLVSWTSGMGEALETL
jgi:hypothetical protein